MELIRNTVLIFILFNFLSFKEEIPYFFIYLSNRNILLAFSNFIDLSNQLQSILNILYINRKNISKLPNIYYIRSFKESISNRIVFLLINRSQNTTIYFLKGIFILLNKY
jgi:hypothetical protein